MTVQIQHKVVAPEVLRPLFDSGKLLAESGLEPNLLLLVKLRTSQMNRCIFCLALHMREGAALHESSDRLVGLAAWRDAPWYTARERAALEWTEILTRICDREPDEDFVYRMREHFSDREIIYLTMAVNVSNSWNRMNVAFHTPAEDAEAAFKALHAAQKVARRS